MFYLLDGSWCGGGYLKNFLKNLKKILLKKNYQPVGKLSIKLSMVYSVFQQTSPTETSLLLLQW